MRPRATTPSPTPNPRATGAASGRGFRLSVADVFVLMAGVAGAFALGAVAWWGGLVVALAVLHFFLFCNVFRLSRPPELVWAVVFTGLAGASARWGVPGWGVTTAGAVVLAAALIARETRKPWYHGVGWRTLNPGLPAWWRAGPGSGAGRRLP